jgi:hypothetical protein
VAALLEDLDEVRTDPTGGSCDGDLGLHRWFLSRNRAVDPLTRGGART